jgi:flavin reductase (DIM6/NTAB) family NADH-FMN oxidoreductase RutF
MVQARRPFKDLEATRQDFDSSTKFGISKTVSPDWKWGDGANDRDSGLEKKHIEVDPSDPGRSAMSNYKLLISGIIPRPIGFLSTQNEDGTSQNLAPFSYTQVVNHDPPIFVVGFAGSSDKDTLKNLKTTGECVINMISEHFIEAANAAAIDAPYGMSEWQLTGLTPASCRKVKVDRVRESMFSIEGRLLEIKDFESKFTKGVKSGSMAIIEGVHFWIREDALSKDQTTIDPAVLRPVARLGGMVYGRVMQAFEIPRPKYAESKDQLPNC